MVGCKCGGICNDKHCPCQKDNLSCGDGCGCSSDECMNRIKRPDIRGFFLPPPKKPKPSSPLISELSNNIEDEDNDINCSTSTKGTSQDTSNKKYDTSYKCTMEVCSICTLRLPTLYTGRKYMTCCGKVICSGCLHAPRYDYLGNKVDNRKCAFCRAPAPKTNEEAITRMSKRVEADDPLAIGLLASYYREGKYEYPRDHTKAFELLHLAAELGNAKAYNSIGYAYDHGKGVEVDKKKARHYFELAAIGGDEVARHNLGIMEKNADRALKHFMLAVRGGHSKSLNMIQKLWKNGFASMEDTTEALQLYQTYLNEIKSDQRDKAAKRCRCNRYY